KALQEPKFDEEEEAVVYEFARQLQQHGTVELPVYERAVELWGAAGVGGLTAVVGYYTMVSMTLNVHEIPMPDDKPAPLDTPMQGGKPLLTTLQKARNWEPAV